MRTWLFLMLSLTVPVAFAQLRIDCSQPNVYCMSEFTSHAQQAQNFQQLLTFLPPSVRQNFTLKRGNNITKTIGGRAGLNVGPHGHLAPNNDSQSATPEQPRVFVWDERTGFTASWNSGNPAHLGHDQIDLYDFDFSTNQHRLFAWTTSRGIIGPTTADTRGRTCVQCHGEGQRPIFAMYPDWPQFYGEFNDEMAGYPQGQNALRSDLRIMGNDFQPRERALYNAFLQNQARTNPRYQLLYSVKPSSGLNSANPFYPFRPRNTVSPFSDVSRAFYHRPNLRLGVMYNRFAALATFEKIKKSPVFQQYPDIILYSLMDCDWGIGQATRTRILDRFTQGIAEIDPSLRDTQLRGAMFTPADLPDEQLRRAFHASTRNGQPVFYPQRAYSESAYRQIPYEDLLKVLGLNIADIDIRFRFDARRLFANQRFDVFDPRNFYFTNSVMDLGYINPTYALNPTCDNAGTPCRFSYEGTYMQGKRYFNSYFDGSATTNELIAAQALRYLVNTSFSPEQSSLVQVRSLLRRGVTNADTYFETLNSKYSRFSERLAVDRPFFQKMDEIGPWLQLPYPEHLYWVHNRETFWSQRISQVQRRHAQWLTLADRSNSRRNEASLCWRVLEVMQERYP